MINYGIAYDFCRISYALIENNLSILMQVTGTVDTRYIAVLYDMVLHTTHMVRHENDALIRVSVDQQKTSHIWHVMGCSLELLREK